MTLERRREMLDNLRVALEEFSRPEYLNTIAPEIRKAIHVLEYPEVVEPSFRDLWGEAHHGGSAAGRAR